jgi:thiaminase/transcriptional activator TenA
VAGIGDGSLDRDAFRRYVAQDAFFLHAFLRAYALAAARSETVGDAAVFHELMGGVLAELELHARYAQALGIDLAHITPYPACRAYTDFLLRTAWTASLGETLAALTPCMRLYVFLGTELAKGRGVDGPYADWIKTYSSPEISALGAKLEMLLDRVAADTPAVRDAYRYAMECELEFFSAPLEAAQSSGA